MSGESDDSPPGSNDDGSGGSSATERAAGTEDVADRTARANRTATDGPTGSATDRSASAFDPTSAKARDIGRGVFEEDMGPGSSMAHLYRGEIHRMKCWRERLDRTTYWAVTVIAALLTFAFANLRHPHYLLLIATSALTAFLVIESRRFRGYDIWRSRVRLLQENVFATALDPSRDVPDPEWRRELSADYRQPTVKIPFEEALAHRLRRVYLLLFSFVLAAWVFRITAFEPVGWPTSAAVGSISGIVVTGVVAAFYAVLLVVAYRPRTWHVAGELRTTDVGAWDDPDRSD